MSRDDGFAIADFATSHFDDPKVKTLWRALAPDRDAMCRALTLHAATVLMSWREGRRVTAQDAAPSWMLDIDQDIANLTSSGLLDAETRVTRTSFNKWFGAAKRRREATRREWRDRQAKRRARVKSEGDDPLESPVTPRIRPSVPSDRPSGRARSREGPTKIGANGEDRVEAIARARARLNDPASSGDVRTAARFALERLGVSA